MDGGFKIARIFGIKIYLDWSWIFIFVLVTWNLVALVFPSIHPEWSFGLTFAVGLSASLLFFASVVAHELAHSLVAKARGLPISEITLFLFGGVSNLQKEPTSPQEEFIMALVGPLTSIILGVSFLIIGLFLIGSSGRFLFSPQTSLSQIGPVPTLLFWLGPINIFLGIFNLIPGFPLDDGRLLRSILWAATNNLEKATKYASFGGRAVGWLFILTGIFMAIGANIPFLGADPLGGLWLVFIGWFLNNIARQSYEEVIIEKRLEGVAVSSVMNREFSFVSPDITVSDLVYQKIMKTDSKAFPVVSGEDLVGIVCLDDVRKISQDEWEKNTVGKIMTPKDKLDIAYPEENTMEVLEKLVAMDICQLPVIKDGKVVGMIDRKDILEWVQLHLGKKD